MFILASHLRNLPILSLALGQVVSSVDGPLVSLDKLEIVAVYCKKGPWRSQSTVIMVRDIREIAREGLIIDSPEDIEAVGEIVRLKAVIDQGFEPVGIDVVTQSGVKLGRIEDYTIDVVSFKIQKLYLKQSVFKNLLLNNLVVDRSQIIDVTKKQIVVKDATVAKAARGLAPTPLPQTPR